MPQHNPAQLIGLEKLITSLPVESLILMSKVRILPQQKRQQQLELSLAEYKTSPSDP